MKTDKLIFTMCLIGMPFISLGFFSSSAAGLEMNNYDTAKMTYFEELDEFAPLRTYSGDKFITSS